MGTNTDREPTAALPADLGEAEEQFVKPLVRPLTIAQAVALAREGRSEELIGAVTTRLSQGGRMRWVNAMAHIATEEAKAKARECDAAVRQHAAPSPLELLPIVEFVERSQSVHSAVAWAEWMHAAASRPGGIVLDAISTDPSVAIMPFTTACSL